MSCCQKGGDFQRRPGSQSNATEAKAQLKIIVEVGHEAVTLVELQSRPKQAKQSVAQDTKRSERFSRRLGGQRKGESMRDGEHINKVTFLSAGSGRAVVLHIFSASIWQAEVEASRHVSQPGLLSEFQDNQGYTEEPHLKNKTKPTGVAWGKLQVLVPVSLCEIFSLVLSGSSDPAMPVSLFLTLPHCCAPTTKPIQMWLLTTSPCHTTP